MRRPQSPELAGGAGFTFEGAVAAFFCVSLLAESPAPGIEARAVTRVAVQQRDMGCPLDDVIVDFTGEDGSVARLGLQCKRRLQISAAASNSDFFEVIRDSWSTITAPDFRDGVDRVGAAANEVNRERARALRALCEGARASPSLADFEARVGPAGNINQDMREVCAAIVALIARARSAPAGLAEAYRLLRHFVLLTFDFLHAGAFDPPEAIDRITACLAAPEPGKAALVWSHLLTLTRAGAGHSAVFDRPTLVRALVPLARLRAAASFRADIEILTGLARSYADAILDDVGGVHLPRPSLDAKLETALAEGRLIQLQGQAGCGKSVLLKRRLIEAVEDGPVLFLKADQLDGRSWRGFATHHGLSSGSLKSLLLEIGTAGTPILFIDAIDRIETIHQPVVAEILRLIARDPNLASWKVITSLRDNGVELLRVWLGDILDAMPVSTVLVGILDNDDASELAKSLPLLRPMLYGSQAVQDIVRRPFFAKVLAQGYAVIGSGFEPGTEAHLANHWWQRGGYDASGRAAIVRQRAIVELASLRVSRPSEPIPVRSLGPATVEEIASLIADGIIQWIRLGHDLRFSHDIFFEWALYHRLEDDTDWVEMIRAIGEPPVAARPVELLAQAHFAAGDQWRLVLPRLAQSGMRSQWLRAWLLGPIGSSAFLHQTERYWEVVSADDFRLLKKALIWFQAEKTTPNPNILKTDALPPDERQRAADILGWPSNFADWMRLVHFLVAAADLIPTRLYPELLTIFEVWQRTLGELANPTSKAVLDRCASWLEKIDARDDALHLRHRRRPGRSSSTPAPASGGAEIAWRDVPEFGAFRDGLITLILGAAKAYPDHSAALLRRALSDRDLLDPDFGKILALAPTLAQVHPSLLVDAVLLRLREELPDEKAARQRAENAAAAEARRVALAKPEDQRTRIDQAAIDGLFSIIGVDDISPADWGSLCLNRDFENFTPAAPSREPFPSLFAFAPDEALRLVRELSAHAMKAWRQLHRRDRRREGTPIPLRIPFPWGEQAFWGGAREFLWFRGHLAPDALGSALTALDVWAAAELQRGIEPDAVIRKAVDGNDCIAVLGVAAAVAVESECVSETSLALVTSQRLLIADRQRWRQDSAAQFGARIDLHHRGDQRHAAATKANDDRPVRQRALSGLVPAFLLGEERYADRLKAAFATFEDDLPFTREEQRENADTVAALGAEASEWKSLADPGLYRAYRTETPNEVVIVHENPSANSPEAQARREDARHSLQVQVLWGIADRIFEAGRVDDPDAYVRHLALAREIDAPDLYSRTDGDLDRGMQRAGVAAMAATVLRFRHGQSEAVLNWARDVLVRAISAPTADEPVSSRSHIPWHEAGFAVRGIAADIRAGTADHTARRALLTLVGHSVEVVATRAVCEAFGLWDVDPRLGWAALSLGLALCRFRRQRYDDEAGERETPADRFAAALANAEAILTSVDWPPLPSPPPAWIQLSPHDPRKRRYQSRDDIANAIDPMEIWIHPDEHWNGHWAAELLALAPVGTLLESPARASFLASMGDYLDWTIARNAPPWKKPDRRSDPDSHLYEWTHGLASRIGHILSYCSLEDVRARLFDPILAQSDEACWSLLTPLANTFVCAAIYDAPQLHADAMTILLACCDRLLAAPELQRERYRSGKLHGFDQPKLPRILLLVSVDHAGGAVRFANGDWKEIGAVLPVVDRLTRQAGWVPEIMGSFLTLCERARDFYPADLFAEQVLAILGSGDNIPDGWSMTLLPARIAGMIQHLANRDAPLTTPLAQSLLRLLDRLVDMGDRRAAALQLTEAFREVRLPPIGASS